jgi:DNA topoisomerase-1
VAGQTVVIVESPAKAKTINKYLGSDYKVLASFGHIRDVPPKDGSVRPDEDFAIDWEYAERGKQHVDEITKAVKTADRVLLASDPDREGEAIAWHIQEVLLQKKAIDRRKIERITFNEITKAAVLEAIKNPRELDQPSWWMPIWPAAPLIIWWALHCRLFCGASCPAPNRQGACNRWRCA